MAASSESDDSLWDGEVQEFKVATALKLNREETSNSEEDVQEYMPAKPPPPILLPKMNREETSGWEDDVQEYGESVSPLPNVPGQEKPTISPQLNQTTQLADVHQRKISHHSNNIKSSSDSSFKINLQNYSDAKEPKEEKKDMGHLPTLPEVNARRSEEVDLDESSARSAEVMPTNFRVTPCVKQKSQTLSSKKNANIESKECDSLMIEEVERTSRSWSLYDSPSSTLEPITGKMRWGSFSGSYTAKSKTKGKKIRDFEFVRMEQIIMLHKGAI